MSVFRRVRFTQTGPFFSNGNNTKPMSTVPCSATNSMPRCHPRHVEKTERRSILFPTRKVKEGRRNLETTLGIGLSTLHHRPTALPTILWELKCQTRAQTGVGNMKQIIWDLNDLLLTIRNKLVSISDVSLYWHNINNTRRKTPT